MAMMFVMGVTVLMQHRFVAMFVLMAFNEVKVESERHQAACENKL